MPQNPPAGTPQVTPMLWYDDVAAALEWLEKSFGLATRMTMPGPDGKIVHAEMTIGDGVVMMGPPGMPHQCSPRELTKIPTALYVYVDDVDAHCDRARASGAEITSEPETMFWGDRIYTAADLEGHRWTFSQHVTDVAPEDMKPPGA